MNGQQRPTFGATLPTPGPNAEQQRSEIGAIWSRTSKTNSEFLSIKLNITKEFLKQLAETNEETVSVNLVAFPNRFKDEAPNRPDFRIYEEKKRI